MNRIRVAFVVTALLGCKHHDSRQVERARELMSIGEWANARTELKLELKEHPGDTQTRGLMLYCLARIDNDQALLDLYLALRTVTSPEWRDAKPELRAGAEKAMIEARQSLYEKGIDTKDAADLADVVLAAARFGFEHDDDADHKDIAAAVLARDGDRDALAHLTDRLKIGKPDKIVTALVAVGANAIPALKRVAGDHDFIGHGAALEALARIEAQDASRAFANGHAFKELDHSAVARQQLPTSSIAARWDLPPVHATYAPGDTPVVLFQAWDGNAKTVAAKLYGLRDGELVAMRLVRDRASFELGGPSVVYGVNLEGSTLTLKRVQRRTTTREIETGRVAAPQLKQRVHLRGYTQPGEIIREDNGLWVVHVTEPIDGMTELPVSQASLIGLKTQQISADMVETIKAHVDGDTVQITKVDEEPRPATSDDMIARMEEFQDAMCGCTDKACADRVQDEMTTWGSEAARKSSKWDKPDPAMVKKAGEIMTKYTECMTKLMSAGMGGGDAL